MQIDVLKMYAAGIGVPQDYEEAVKWYFRAAKQGSSEAQFELGFMYSSGRGPKTGPGVEAKNSQVP